MWLYNSVLLLADIKYLILLSNFVWRPSLLIMIFCRQFSTNGWKIGGTRWGWAEPRRQLMQRVTTGCFRFIVKMFELITQARKQPISSDRWHFFLLIGTFWYLVSKKFHNHSVIIHLVRNLRCETVKIWKIH